MKRLSIVVIVLAVFIITITGCGRRERSIYAPTPEQKAVWAIADTARTFVTNQKSIEEIYKDALWFTALSDLDSIEAGLLNGLKETAMLEREINVVASHIENGIGDESSWYQEISGMEAKVMQHTTALVSFAAKPYSAVLTGNFAYTEESARKMAAYSEAQYTLITPLRAMISAKRGDRTGWVYNTTLIEHFIRAIELDPGNVQYYRGLIRSAQNMGYNPVEQSWIRPYVFHLFVLTYGDNDENRQLAHDLMGLSKSLE